MNISAPFIRRPVATSLLVAAVMLSGTVAYFLLPVAPLPRVEFPTLSVQAGLPGASPETMASAVATPLERRFGRIAGLTEMTSSSALGTTTVTLQFDLDRDVTSAARDVQAAINAAGGELPPNLPTRPNIRKVNPTDAPIIILALRSQTLPMAQVFDAANSVVAQKISQIDGVGQVLVAGGQQPAVRVRLDPRALAGQDLTPADVRAALAASTANLPKGTVGGGDGQRSFTVAANDQLFGAEAFSQLIVRYREGAALRLGDVAFVYDDVENDRLAAWSDGRRAVLLIVRRQPGANILATIERIREAIPRLTDSISPAIAVEVALDRTATIRASVRDVETTLVIAVVLVTLVVFVFLRSVRATVIPTVVAPLSLVGTFGVMYLLDYSLNNLSLMALTIATGFVVDDAIVVTENVVRLVERGRRPRDAALEGARQIGFTIVSITTSLIAVFIPILLMGGIVGRLFREFSVTLAVAVAISAVVSLTVTPAMAARLLPARADGTAGPNRLQRAAAHAFDRLTAGYARALDWALGHGPVMLLLTAATVALTVFLAVRIPKGLFPQQDTGLLAGFTEGPQDISSRAMRERQDLVNAALSRDPDVEHAVAFLGAGPGATGNSGNVFVALKPVSERQGRASADQIIARLRPKLAQIPGVTLFLQAQQDVRIGGRGARTQFQYTLEGARLAELQQWAPRLLERLRKMPELRDVASDQQNAGLELRVIIDRDTAGRLGVTPQAIDDALYDTYGQRQVATSFTAQNYYRVVLEAAAERQEGPDQLAHIHVRSALGGGLVPLSALSRVEIGKAPLAVTHQGQLPAVTISFNLTPGVALGQAVEAIDRVRGEMGFPPDIGAGFRGTARAFSESLATQPWLIFGALVTVYLVLGILYESLIHPLTILSTLPSAALGALVALYIAGLDFSIIALIGVILLLGIVKKNAIMMIDFALEAERTEGLGPREAIRRACLLRFRPILMTTLAALLGAVPLAVGLGAGSELRRPLGITIIGGLAASQILNLLLTPVVFVYLDGLRADRRRARRTAAPGH